MDSLSSAQTKALLALDIRGAFDNVSHDLILENLASTRCGRRVYDYVKAFLTDRTATIGLGSLRSDIIKLAGKGTPQGSVLSPTLFNIAMAKLPPLLTTIPSLRHALYADDVTIWVTKGSDGQIQDALQEAVNVVQDYARAGGLTCSAEKSELLHIRRPQRNPDKSPHITVMLEDHVVHCVKKLRVLGLYIQADLKATYTMKILEQQVSQITHMIRRITNRRHGLQEQDILRIVNACIVNRVTYHVPYQTLTLAQERRLDVILRRAVKAALGLPTYASTERLLAMGVHNNVKELIEAQRNSQIRRLRNTQVGERLLISIGYPPNQCKYNVADKQLPSDLRARITIAPLPRNMHPERNAGRRRARVKNLTRLIDQSPPNTVLYSDAARHRFRDFTVGAVVNNDHDIVASISVPSKKISEGEECAGDECAVALAIAHAAVNLPHADVIQIFTDSQDACRAFTRGIVSQHTHRILNTAFHTPHRFRLIWTPGHASLPGHDCAHAATRALTNREPEEELSNPDERDVNTELLGYRDTLDYYRRERLRYPPPHHTLTREDATAMRQLQANTFPNLHFLHILHPTSYPDKCPGCGAVPTLFHVTLECQRPPARCSPISSPIPTLQDWEAMLRDGSPSGQRALVRRARDAAAAVGALD